MEEASRSLKERTCFGADQSEAHPADLLAHVGKSISSSRISISKAKRRVRREPGSWESQVFVCVHMRQGWRRQPCEDFVSLGFTLKAMGNPGRVLS